MASRGGSVAAAPVTAVAGAATLNAQNGIVTSEALISANSYTLTLTNSVILAGSTLLVNAYDGTNVWLPKAVAVTAGAAAISLVSLSSPSNSRVTIFVFSVRPARSDIS
jgi:hypothetical protein